MAFLENAVGCRPHDSGQACTLMAAWGTLTCIDHMIWHWLRQRSSGALETFRREYAEQHQTTINKRLHLIGRCMRIAAVPLAFWSLWYGLALFAGGYAIQFLGHAIEGTSPSFFRNPKHLLLGSLEHLVRLTDRRRSNDEKA